MRSPDRAPGRSAPAPDALLSLPGVLGVGFGVKERGGELTGVLSWRVYVREKKPRHLVPEAERVPPKVDDLPTDVVEKVPTRAMAGDVGTRLRPPPAHGARIANARGVPGSLGCLAVTQHDGAAVLLSNHHVLFGAGAGEREPVWLVEGDEDAPGFRRVGSSLYGKLGTVVFGGSPQHVDCAVAMLVDTGALPLGWRLEPDVGAEPAEPLAPGAEVTKAGAVTGTTRGVIVDIAYPDVALIEGRTRPAPGQILVRPAVHGVPFSAEGDSGAVLRDSGGGVVGLLWGANERGESIACHIAPVLQVLGIRPVRAFPPRPREARPRRSLLERIGDLFR